VRWLRRGLEPLALARILAAGWTEATVYAAALSASVLFARRALHRHDVFESNAYDLAFFDQIIWNTAHGRWFQTSFTTYNFLGQHFDPILLLFALAYRFGAGVKLLLLMQTIFVGAAALPLFYAVRRGTGSGATALAASIAFLLSPQLHRALDFDFHPELMGFFFVFLALYYVVAGRPVATIVAVLPLLLLKEDMPLIVGGVGVLLFERGFRRHGLALFVAAAWWAVAVVLVFMPWIRGGSGDLAGRYGYLVANSTWWSVVPDVVRRSTQQLWLAPVDALMRLGASTGFVGLLNPLALLVAAPAYLLAALSDHNQQSRLELHYVTATLALVWVAVALGLQRLSKWGRRRSRSLAVPAASILVLASSASTFFLWSPYWPRAQHYAPSAAHRAVIDSALALVPAGVPVSAQNTLLPHLSERKEVFEFPNLDDAEYVVVDPSLPVTGQSSDGGYSRVIEELPGRGFVLIFDSDGVRVFRRAP
jgi:uncharacterized membrane protein